VDGPVAGLRVSEPSRDEWTPDASKRRGSWLQRRGWDSNGSFVFLETGSERREKFLASGQQVAVKGSVIGYYLFRRTSGIAA
jgi:hypothetical protein